MPVSPRHGRIKDDLHGIGAALNQHNVVNPHVAASRIERVNVGVHVQVVTVLTDAGTVSAARTFRNLFEDGLEIRYRFRLIRRYLLNKPALAEPVEIGLMVERRMLNVIPFQVLKQIRTVEPDVPGMRIIYP